MRPEEGIYLVFFCPLNYIESTLISPLLLLLIRFKGFLIVNMNEFIFYRVDLVNLLTHSDFVFKPERSWSEIQQVIIYLIIHTCLLLSCVGTLVGIRNQSQTSPKYNATKMFWSYNIPYDRVQSCNSWQSLFITGDGIDNHIHNYRYKLQSRK